MARGFYRGFRELYARSEITLLCNDQVAGLASMAGFDRTAVFPRARFSRPVALGRELSTSHYDLGVSLVCSYAATILFWASRIPHRVGFDQAGSGAFLSASVSWRGRESGTHKSLLYLELLEFLGGSVRPFPLAPVSKQPHSPPYFVVAPGASIPLREWPYVPELLIWLSGCYPAHQIIVIGSAADGKWSSQVARLGLPNVENRIGLTTLSDVVELCRGATLVFANDSGTAHVSATLAGARTLVFFGPGDPRYVRPDGPATVVRDPSVACSPCEKAVCQGPYGYQVCLRRLEPEGVFSVVEALVPRLTRKEV